jgi:hypothetical protein
MANKDKARNIVLSDKEAPEAWHNLANLVGAIELIIDYNTVQSLITHSVGTDPTLMYY